MPTKNVYLTYNDGIKQQIIINLMVV